MLPCLGLFRPLGSGLRFRWVWVSIAPLRTHLQQQQRVCARAAPSALFYALNPKL
jgi:hypothetical protein